MKKLVTTILCITAIMTQAYGATSNELRDSLGLPRNYYEGEALYTENEDGKHGILDEETADGVIKQTEEDNELDKMVEEKDKLTGDLEIALKGNKAAKTIVSLVDSLISKTKEIESYSKSNSAKKDEGQSFVKDGFGKIEVLDNEFEYTRVIGDSFSEQDEAYIKALNYDIGAIGEDSISVVGSGLKLVTPWGYTKSLSSDNFDYKLTGIELKTNAGDEIRSQWNGIVVDICKDYTGNYEMVKMYHGNSTYTLYSKIWASDDIKIGDKIYQGGCIGEAADTSEFEANKENNMFYQIRLNGEFINPILIYGSRGKQIYESWYTSTSDVNIVDTEEKYFNDIKVDEKDKVYNEVKDVLYTF